MTFSGPGPALCRLRRIAFLCAAIALMIPVFAAGANAAEPSKKDKEASAVPDVPGDEIFGFTSPTDVGQPGDKGFANENDGRWGKRDGRYNALNTKYEFSSTFAENWWIAGSLFGAHNFSRNVTDLNDIDNVNFDGASFEIAHRIITRSAGNPFAVTLSVEPRWGRIDGTSGRISNAFNAAFKIFIDAVVVPETLFWAANLYFTPQTAENVDMRGRWLASSSTFVSTALTYQVSPQLFVGAEARYLSAFNSAWLEHNAGNALYLGPTLMWKVTDKVGFNTTYQPQIAGHSAANPNLNLDLDNFERAQFRAKLAVALN